MKHLVDNNPTNKEAGTSSNQKIFTLESDSSQSDDVDTWQIFYTDTLYMTKNKRDNRDNVMVPSDQDEND